MAERLTYLMVLALLLAQACVEQPKGKTKEEVIQEKVTERLSRWERSWRRSCTDKALERAGEIVDSTILARARANRDTSVRSLIPPRPEKPVVEMPLDTVPVEPFLKKEEDTVSGG
jgi:hypothetical protein